MQPDQPATLRGAVEAEIEWLRAEQARMESMKEMRPAEREDYVIRAACRRDSANRLQSLLDSYSVSASERGERIKGYIVCLTEEEVGDWLYPSTNDDPKVWESTRKKMLAAEVREALLLPAECPTCGSDNPAEPWSVGAGMVYGDEYPETGFYDPGEGCDDPFHGDLEGEGRAGKPDTLAQQVLDGKISYADYKRRGGTS